MNFERIKDIKKSMNIGSEKISLEVHFAYYKIKNNRIHFDEDEFISYIESHLNREIISYHSINSSHIMVEIKRANIYLMNGNDIYQLLYLERDFGFKYLKIRDQYYEL